jgi:glutathione synthase/RimK-type ligase-like ATP-grasp enzyme
MLPVIYPYKIGSASAVLLSSALSCKRVFPNKTYKHKPNHLIINWGLSSDPNWWKDELGDNWLNIPYAVGRAANKITAFYDMQDTVKIPLFWTSKDSAKRYMEAGGFKVVCRTLLSGHSGAGIVIATTPEELVDAPLYTQFIEKDKEYRVHVFNGFIIDYQQKKRRRGVECNDDVRNHHTGWVYARTDVVLPEGVATNAIRAVSSLGLDFGAVDLCTDRNGNVFVFEVNTAPGITGSTLDKYVEAIKELL